MQIGIFNISNYPMGGKLIIEGLVFILSFLSPHHVGSLDEGYFPVSWLSVYIPFASLSLESTYIKYIYIYTIIQVYMYKYKSE